MNNGANRIARQFLAELPFERQVDAALDNAEAKIAGHPVTKRLQEFHARLPAIPARDIPTPLGTVRIPEVKPPGPTPPKIDSRRREAMKAAIAIDVSSVVGVIPIVGDAVADVVEDVYAAKLRESLTTEEMDKYIKYDKLGPSTLALARTFAGRA